MNNNRVANIFYDIASSNSDGFIIPNSHSFQTNLKQSSFMLSPTLFSILVDLYVLLPVLIGVAFVTVAERKTLGSMQRRLGPNITGAYGSLQAFKNKRKFHTSSFIFKSEKNNTDKSLRIEAAIKTLYKDRVAPVKPFDNSLILASCDNYLDLKEKKIFLDK